MIIRNQKPHRSTTLYNVICSCLTAEENQKTLRQKIELGRKYIFNFDYVTPDSVNTDTFKQYFENMFISKFAECYIACETFELFQLKLESKMNEVMPTYCDLLAKFYSGSDDFFMNKSTTLTEDERNSNNKTARDTKTSNHSASGSVSSKFPSNIATAGKQIANVKYANDGNKSETDANETTADNSTSNTTDKSNGKSVTVSGSYLSQFGIYKNDVLHLFTELINEFQPLFSIVM